MWVYSVKTSFFCKFFTSPSSPPCEGGERGVVYSVAALLRYDISF